MDAQYMQQHRYRIEAALSQKISLTYPPMEKIAPKIILGTIFILFWHILDLDAVNYL